MKAVLPALARPLIEAGLPAEIEPHWFTNQAEAAAMVADADIAESMSELVRAQILQQAGISVLAQANQAPALVLQLLK